MTGLPSAVHEVDSVLVTGPSMTGKYDLFHRLLNYWADAPIVISTGRTAEKVRTDHERITDTSGENVVVIDCVTEEQGIDVADSTRTRYVSSPGNLTDVGVKFTNVVDDLDDDASHAVGLYSISQLLMYWEPERIYQFTRVLSSQASGEGWPFVAVIGSTMHDEEVLHTIYEPFEVIVETRVEDDTRQFRVRERVGPPGEWTDF